MVSAIAKVRLRSTGRATRASAAAKVWPKTFSSCPLSGKPCPFSRATFAISSTGAPREVLPGHGCWFCGIRARDGGSRWLGAEPRDAGTERRALPSFRRGGRADRRSRGRDGRVDRVARGGCRAIRGGHYLERTSLAPGTGGERTFTTGATTTRWPTKAEVASAATIFDWTGSNEAVCSSACGYVATIASGPAIQLEPRRYRAESADRVPQRTGSARSCEETTTEWPRRHQISGARRRACGDGAARGASSPRGG